MASAKTSRAAPIKQGIPFMFSKLLLCFYSLNHLALTWITATSTQFPRCAIFAGEQFAGIGIADDFFLRDIPFDFSPRKH